MFSAASHVPPPRSSTAIPAENRFVECRIVRMLAVIDGVAAARPGTARNWSVTVNMACPNHELEIATSENQVVCFVFPPLTRTEDKLFCCLVGFPLAAWQRTYLARRALADAKDFVSHLASGLRQGRTFDMLYLVWVLFRASLSVVGKLAHFIAPLGWGL
jgi:hypothetical protein